MHNHSSPFHLLSQNFLLSEDILDGVIEAVLLRGEASAYLGRLRQTKIS